MKKLMILSSILISVNSLMAVNNSSTKSENWDIDRTFHREKISKFFSTADSIGDNNVYTFSNKPLELEYFDAAFLNEGIMVKWQNFSSNKDLKFELQKSYDGIYFEKLTIIEKDCTSDDNYYTYLDTELKLNSEIVYYRLKQIDNSDRISYSDIIYLDSSNELGFN